MLYDTRFVLEPGLPGARRLFLTESLSDAEQLYEVIDGRITAKRLTVYDIVVGNRLALEFFKPDQLQQVGDGFFGMLYDLPEVDNFYRPEVSFVPHSNWPESRRLDHVEAWSVIPSLVAEVIGRYRVEEEIAPRVEEYFRAGAQMVWIVNTVECEVRVHVSSRVVRVLNMGDELTADPLVPGFRIPVADLFPLTEAKS